MKDKLFTLGFVIVISVLLINGCKVTTDQPTDDWQTYRNEKYGYSFKYPPDCFYGPLPPACKIQPREETQERPSECLCSLNGEDPDRVIMERMYGEGITSFVPFYIYLINTPENTPPPGIDLNTWIKDAYSSIPWSVPEDIPDVQNIELGGIPAFKFYYPKSPTDLSKVDILFIKDDKLFRIYMFDLENENNRKLYDQLLSSFRFEN